MQARVRCPRRPSTAVFVFVLVGGHVAGAAPPANTPLGNSGTPEATTQASAAPRVTVESLTGTRYTGRLLELHPEVVIDLQDAAESAGDVVRVAWTEVARLSHHTDENAPPTTTSPRAPLRFELSDGSTVFGRVLGAEDVGFRIRFDEQREAVLTKSMLRTIVSTDVSTAARDVLDEQRAAHARQARPDNANLQDRAIVARGEQAMALRGSVGQIMPNALQFAWNGRQLDLPWARVVGVIFARPSPRNAPCKVFLHDETVLAGEVIGGSSQSVVLRSSIFGNTVLPWSRVAEIVVANERLVFLSDLQQMAYEFEPFLFKRWAFARDKTLFGKPIRLRGEAYGKGITMHSRSRLSYRLPADASQFAASVGIVDDMEQRGCVSARVLADGRVLWEANAIRGGAEPLNLLLDVNGVRELTLVVDYGDGLDLSDHLAWAMARIIR